MSQINAMSHNFMSRRHQTCVSHMNTISHINTVSHMNTMSHINTISHMQAPDVRTCGGDLWGVTIFPPGTDERELRGGQGMSLSRALHRNPHDAPPVCVCVCVCVCV